MSKGKLEIENYFFFLITLLLTKHNKKYEIQVKRGDDVLSGLDKFSKKRKIKLTAFDNIEVKCDEEKGITGCRIARAVVETLSLVVN